MSEFEMEVILDRDLSSLCRTCLKRDGVISLFSDKVSDTGYTLQERIMAFAYVEIFEGDGLPSKICRACLTQINRAFNLKAQCEYADLILRQHCPSEITNDSEELKIDNTDEEIIEEFIAENDVRHAPKNVVEDSVDDVILEELPDSPGASGETKYFYPQIKIGKTVKQSYENQQSTHTSISTVKRRDKVSQCSESLQSGIAISRNNKITATKTLEPGQTFNVIIKDSEIMVNKSVEPMQLGNTVSKNRKIINSILGSSHTQEVIFDGAKSLLNVEPINPKNAELSRSNKAFACNLCDKTFHFKGSLASHLLKEHEPSGEFACNYCGSAFSQELLLSLHVNSHTAERPFCCSVCGKRFMEASSLKTHEKRHRKDKGYLCIHCGKFFTYKNDHYCRLANPIKEKAHPCNICGKKFLRISTLTTHKKRHRVVERFQCKTCSKPFYSRQELERHTNVHLGLRPFACDFENCEHTFYSQGELNRHKKYHLGEKKFKCDLCHMAFYESGHLTNHKRKHTGERPYICEICPKTFTDSSKLKRHINTHYKIPRSNSKPTTETDVE